MKSALLKFFASILFIIASIVSCNASVFWFYQPRTPKCLRR